MLKPGSIVENKFDLSIPASFVSSVIYSFLFLKSKYILHIFAMQGLTLDRLRSTKKS